MRHGCEAGQAAPRDAARRERAPGPMTDHRERIEALELILLDPSGRADAALLDRLIADDFVEVAANGRSFGKDEVLARLPVEQGVSFSAGPMAVTLLSPTVGLVTYTVTRTVDGVPVHSRRCSVWRLHQDQWQVVYHQGTVAQGAAPT